MIITICLLVIILLITLFKLKEIRILLDKAKKLNLENKIHYEQEQIKTKKSIDKLELQIKEKTRELAVRAREIEEKNELIDFVHSKLTDAVKHPAKTSIRLNEMELELSRYLKLEDHTFELQMDELNQDFMKTLKVKYPEITSLDLRICLYIKTGMSSHEIAKILNVLPSSIYISRSRLRKKLGLSVDQDLLGFLTSLQTQK